MGKVLKTTTCLLLLALASLFSITSNQSGVFANDKDPLKNLNVFVSLDAGRDHTLAVTNRGQLYGWGSNTRGQLGIDSLTPTSIKYPYKNKTTNNILFNKVSCGSNFSLALSSEGQIYGFGDNAYQQTGIYGGPTIRIPTLLEFPDVFKSIEAGDDCSFALNRGGRLYSWGRNTKGQLGQNKQEKSESGEEIVINYPTPVEHSLIFTKVVSLNNVVLALHANGYLYSWGDNTYGQLGLGDILNLEGEEEDNYITKPTRIDKLYKMNRFKVIEEIEGPLPQFIDIALGEHTAYALTDFGNLYSWGYDLYGQLGFDEKMSEIINVPLLNNSDIHFSNIASGDNHLLLKDANSNYVYGCGHNNHGQLGNERIADIIGIQRLYDMSSYINDGVLIAASDHTFLFNLQGKIMECGYNQNGVCGKYTTEEADIRPEDINANAYLFAYDIQPYIIKLHYNEAYLTLKPRYENLIEREKIMLKESRYPFYFEDTVLDDNDNSEESSSSGYINALEKWKKICEYAGGTFIDPTIKPDPLFNPIAKVILFTIGGIAVLGLLITFIKKKRSSR